MRKSVLALLVACAALYAADTFTARQREFWSFQKVKAQTAPAVHDAAWARNEIDRFVLAKLESKGLRPSPPADKITLLRRATFDVTGLPAISVPCGFSSSGLPIGLQIVGAPFAESTVLALAYAYEQATEWHRRKLTVLS